MHHNWPYALYAILGIIAATIIIFGGNVGAVMGLCAVYVSHGCILCRFISEQRAYRTSVAAQESPSKT